MCIRRNWHETKNSLKQVVRPPFYSLSFSLLPSAFLSLSEFSSSYLDALPTTIREKSDTVIHQHTSHSTLLAPFQISTNGYCMWVDVCWWRFRRLWLLLVSTLPEALNWDIIFKRRVINATTGRRDEEAAGNSISISISGKSWSFTLVSYFFCLLSLTHTLSPPLLLSHHLSKTVQQS